MSTVRGPLFPELERALTGLGVGDRARVELAPERTYGEPDPSLTFTDEFANVPPELRVLGAEFEADTERGERRTFRATHIEGGSGKLTVDANHPLAGSVLHYEVTVNAIRPPRRTRSARSRYADGLELSPAYRLRML